MISIPKRRKSPFEFGFFRADDQALGDGAEGRLRPRLEHARGRGSAHHRRPQKDEIQGNPASLGIFLTGMGVLFGRHRFARQRRLLKVEIARLHKARVGGNQVTCRKTNQIIRDDLMAFYFLPFPVPQYGRAQADVFPQPLNRTLRTIGLNKIDGDAENNHYDDNSGIRLLTQYA